MVGKTHVVIAMVIVGLWRVVVTTAVLSGSLNSRDDVIHSSGSVKAHQLRQIHLIHVAFSLGSFSEKVQATALVSMY